MSEIMHHCATAIMNATEHDCGMRRGGVAFEVRAMFRGRDTMADRVDIANGTVQQEQPVDVAEGAVEPQLPAPRAPDWEDLYERYWGKSRNSGCSCHIVSPCGYCVDGWQDDINWEVERETTGYVLELDGVK